MPPKSRKTPKTPKTPKEKKPNLKREKVMQLVRPSHDITQPERDALWKAQKKYYPFMK